MSTAGAPGAARRWWPLWGLLAVVGLVLVAVLAWWYALVRASPTPFDKPARVDGRTVEVSYIGSSCQDGSGLDVEEHSDRVVLTVWTWSSATSCDDVGVPYRVSGQLASDLGSRTVVDGACERPELAGRESCRQP